jgi:2-methylcitrate dehydratase PrpD
MRLVAGSPETPELSGPAVPGGLAIKLYPACYAVQRPIGAVLAVPPIDIDTVSRIVVCTPEAAVTPLIHHRPVTGLQAKFSLEYAVAAALLDRHPGLDSFSDSAVRRPAVQRLLGLVDVRCTPGGAGLLDGEVEIAIDVSHSETVRSVLKYPPGAPQRPPTDRELSAKITDCVSGTEAHPRAWTWANATDALRG